MLSRKNLRNIWKQNASFPRFYFLSNDELWKYWRKRKISCCTALLEKVFDNLVKLELKAPVFWTYEKCFQARGRSSFREKFKARGTVEEWLTSVEDRMRVALKGCMREGALDFAKRDRMEWVFSHPAQVVNTMDKVMWCYRTENV